MPSIPRLNGPAPSWPRPVDAALEAWATLPARGRAGLRAATVAVLLLAASGGLLRGPWGPPTTVVVAREDLPAGSPVSPADLRLTQRPADLVPPDALRDVTELPPDALTRGHVPSGTVLTGGGLLAGGPAATAVAGTAVLPLPAETLPPIPVGTRVDLAVAGFDGVARIVARDATLVADDGTWRWVLIDRDAVGAVAQGVTEGTLVAAVLPPARQGAVP